MLQPFRKVTDAFIYTFGITPPRPEEERRATFFICALLAGAVLVIAGMMEVILRAIF